MEWIGKRVEPIKDGKIKKNESGMNGLRVLAYAMILKYYYESLQSIDALRVPDALPQVF